MHIIIFVKFRSDILTAGQVDALASSPLLAETEHFGDTILGVFGVESAADKKHREEKEAQAKHLHDKARADRAYAKEQTRNCANNFDEAINL